MKQAVVLIHGIGEQKPMQTLRGFVKALLGPGDAGKEPFWSKPDPMSELMELRRLQSLGRPTTHFYEYYWAYKVEGTKILDVLSWLGHLVRRSGRDVPASAKGLWLTSRVTVLAIILSAILLTVGQLRTWFESQAASFSLAWIVLVLMGLLIQALAVLYLGDAARYLSPRPSNIRLRHAIRSEGVNLLRTLHKRGEYDRIIVVGHSLGSVIGYDLITHLWQEYNEQYPALAEPDTQEKVRECLARKVSVQPMVGDELSKTGEALKPGVPAGITEFQNAQRKAWRELRLLGNPWRISDFVSLGSPLAHGMLLLATGRDDFESRKRQRELPMCPPARDEKGYAYSSPTSTDVGAGKKFTPLVLHHAAPFAVTRWTNVYFPTRLGLFGDLVGGPLQEAFGAGIRDIPVRTKALGGLARFTLLSHTCYWHGPDLEVDRTRKVSQTPSDEHEQLRPALAAVLDAMGLSFLRNFAPRGWDQLDQEQPPDPPLQPTSGD